MTFDDPLAVPPHLSFVLGEAKSEDLKKDYAKKLKSWEREAGRLDNRLTELLAPLKEGGCFVRYVSTRVKRLDSAIESALRKWRAARASGVSATGEFGLREISLLPDLIGSRVVGLNLTDVVRVVRHLLSQEEFLWSRSDIRNYYESAKASNYRSWQIQLDWRRPGQTGRRRVEIQVRSILEDAWAEWEHELFYKPPEGVSSEARQQLREMFRRESRALADQMFEVSQEVDRVRSVFEIHKRLASEGVTLMLRSARHAASESVKDLFSRRLNLDVRAVNLSTGLGEIQLDVKWAPHRFVGFELESAQTKGATRLAEIGSDPPWRFDYEDLEEYGAKLRVRIDSAIQNDKVHSYLESRNFPELAKDLLLRRFREKKESAGRTFFNELVARVDGSYVDGEWWNARGLTLLLSRSNYAYEVCTTHLLDQRRSGVASGPGSDSETRRIEDQIRDILRPRDHVFDINAHGPNPLAMHVTLISVGGSANEQSHVVVVRRSESVAYHRNQWSTSTSGLVVPRRASVEAAGDIPGLIYETRTEGAEDHPSIFRAAQREIEEELGVVVPIDHVRVIAFVVDRETAQPLIFAEAYTPMSFAAIKERWKTATEKWELMVLGQVPLTDAGWRGLVNGADLSTWGYEGTTSLNKVPSILKTGLNAGPQEEDFWDASSAAAVLLTFSRFLGPSVVSVLSG